MIRQQPIYMLNYLIALITVGALLTIERKYVTFISKCIIVLCALFSVMGILESIILWFKPTLVYTKLGNYSSTTSADPISNISAIEYLGFYLDSGPTILGHQLYRMESFASEPSVLVYSFFCPGILSLTYRGWVKILSIPAKTLRAGAILNPEFTGRNVPRDTVFAGITTPGFIPGWDTLVGLQVLFKDGKTYRDWLFQGGAQATIVAMDRTYLSNSIAEVLTKTNIRSSMRNLIMDEGRNNTASRFGVVEALREFNKTGSI